MKKALIVVFYNSPFEPCSLFRTIWRSWITCFLKYADQIDHLYLIDNGYHFLPEELRQIPIPYTVKEVQCSAAKAIDEAFPLIQEDMFLLMHPDTVIYDSLVVKQGFDSLVDYDLAAIFDNSGKPLYKTYPLFQANAERGVRSRFCNYLWFGKTQQIKDIPQMTFEESSEYPEAASYISEKLMERNIRAKELRDDRSNILFEEGHIRMLQWLDVTDQTCPLHLGYYHIRNFNEGPLLIDNFEHHREAYEDKKKIMPQTEFLRVLMWAKTLGNLPTDRIIDDLHISQILWKEYENAFRFFHKEILV